MKFILGEKKEMTQRFAEDGSVIPVTKVVAGPCVITQLKDKDSDGYFAVQVGFGQRKEKNLSKSVRGHLKDTGSFKYLREFKIDENDLNLKIGDKITVAVFKPGDIVKVTGNSKGKGFQGVVKRYGFHGSPKSHGHKDQLRMPGSIGATGPAHVFKGTKMGGRMGGGQVTVKNLEIIEVDLKNNEIFIKGAIPGSRNNLILISGSGDLVMAEEKPEAEVKAEGKKSEIRNKKSETEDKPAEKESAEKTEEEEEPKKEEPKKEDKK